MCHIIFSPEKSKKDINIKHIIFYVGKVSECDTSAKSFNIQREEIDIENETQKILNQLLYVHLHRINTIKCNIILTVCFSYSEDPKKSFI